jgi:hypothetical protein
VLRLLILIMLASLLLAACGSAATPETAAPNAETKPVASPAAGGSPAVRASPSPATAVAAGRSDSVWSTLGSALTSDSTLVIIGILLTIAAAIAWKMSNRAEATPNEDQLAEMRSFVNDHFARYVARGLAVEGTGAVAISRDPAWRKVYLQHLRLHNELYAFRRDVALRIFDAEIDAAVQRQLEEARASGVRANPVVTVT